MATTTSGEKVFEKAIQFVLDIEGGLEDDPDDYGGLTNHGISSTYHPDVDVENLTVRQAIEIYREQYWEEFRCPLLAPAWAVTLFDGVVNQNQEAVVRMLQETVGSTVDGIMGPKTVAHANQNRTAYHVGLFMAKRINRYMTVSKEKYQLGLVRRACECYALARASL